MANVNRPLIGVLAVTVVFFALWLVALKPSGGGGAGASTPALGRYSSDIAKAHGAVATSNHENAKISAAAGGGSATPAAAAHTTGAANHTTGTAAAATHARRTAAKSRVTRDSVPRSRGHTFVTPRHDGPAAVSAALRADRPLALLFYNPAGADDLDVRAELDGLRLPARVLKLAVPIAQVARYAAITQQLAINGAPTLVIVDRAHQATTIVGFASAFEIRARIDAALADH